MKTFDVTIKGFERVHDAEDETREHLPENAQAIADELVKWILAPSMSAIKKFIERYELTEHVHHEPFEMSHRDDGVDLEINADGKVVWTSPGNRQWKEKWLALEKEFARLFDKHDGFRYTLIDAADSRREVEAGIDIHPDGVRLRIPANTTIRREQLFELGWLLIALAGEDHDKESAFELIDGFGLEVPAELES